MYGLFSSATFQDMFFFGTMYQDTYVGICGAIETLVNIQSVQLREIKWQILMGLIAWVGTHLPKDNSVTDREKMKGII